MKWIVEYQENGRYRTTSFDKEGATEQDVVNWFGLEESDIDWYRIRPVK